MFKLLNVTFKPRPHSFKIAIVLLWSIYCLLASCITNSMVIYVLCDICFLLSHPWYVRGSVLKPLTYKICQLKALMHATALNVEDTIQIDNEW